jgi:hypothetical protein
MLTLDWGSELTSRLRSSSRSKLKWCSREKVDVEIEIEVEVVW